ncbi:hypothetical protein ACLOJK_014492 [Asimina triloba]
MKICLAITVCLHVNEGNHIWPCVRRLRRGNQIIPCVEYLQTNSCRESDTEPNAHAARPANEDRPGLCPQLFLHDIAVRGLQVHILRQDMDSRHRAFID